MLLDPARSADPPISSGISAVNKVKISSEDFLVAVGFASLIAAAFAVEKILSNNFELLLDSLFILLFAFCCQRFLSLAPFAPMALHSFNISCGISNGPYFHFNFFLTKFISSSPRGLP